MASSSLEASAHARLLDELKVAEQFDAFLSSASEGVRRLFDGSAVARCTTLSAGPQVEDRSLGFVGPSTDVQRQDLLEQLATHSEGAKADGGWSKAQEELAIRWWDMVSDETVRLACRMHGLARLASTPRPTRVSALVNALAPLVHPVQAALWRSSGVVEAVQQAPPLAQAAPPGVGVLPGRASPLSLEARMVAAMELFAQSQAASQTVQPAPVVAPAQAPLPDAKADYLAKVLKELIAYEYVDPVGLCPSYQEHARSKLGGRTRGNATVELTKGLVISGVASQLNSTESEMGPQVFRLGLDKMLAMMAAEPALAHRIPDFTEWLCLVWSCELGSGVQKVKYFKEFMWKYRGPHNAHDWAGKFRTDFQLMMTYLSDSGKRQRQEEPRNPGQNPKQPKVNPKVPKVNPKVTKKPKTFTKFCYSRMYNSGPKAGPCSYPACKFVHFCPSCGPPADHAANACTAWDQVKASAAIAKV